MLKAFIIALLVVTGTVFAAQAEDKPATVVKENHIQESEQFLQLLEKLRQHPEVAAYISKAEATEHYAKGELGLPDPMLNAQVQNYPLGTSNSKDFEEKMVGFKQEIPAFGTRGAKSEEKQAEAHKTRLTADYTFAMMKAKLITALANWQRIKEQEKILDEQSHLLGSDRKSIKGRIAANQSGISQLSTSQADSTEVDIMRDDLMEQRHEIQAMLMNMVGETPDIVPPPIAIVTWDSDPDKTYPVKIAAEDITMARKEVDMREAEFGPHFAVEADYGRFNDRDNAGTVMVGVSIPLWSSESQRPKLSGAQAALRSSELDQDTVRRDITEKLHHLEAQIKTSGRKIELLKTKAKQLSQGASAITREYEAGKSELSLYLKARRDVLAARLALAAEKARNISLIAEFNSYIVGEVQ